MKIKWQLMAMGITTLALLGSCEKFKAPVTWNMEEIKRFHLPPPASGVDVIYAPESYYDSLPDHVITRTFPVYYQEFERPGYLDSLRRLKPEIIFDASKLKTQEDWIKAGELVFTWPVSYTPMKDTVSRAIAAQSTAQIPTDGVYHFSRYVIDKDRGLMVGSLSCASCHTQVQSGRAIAGAPGNVYNVAPFAKSIRSGNIPFALFKEGVKTLTFAPWAPAALKTTPENADEYADNIQAAAYGVIDRQGTAYLFPVPVPNLFGLKDIRYFDRTGVMKHDNPGDLMRYAAFNQGLDMLTSYDGYIPGGKDKNSKLPASSEWRHPFGYAGKKYTDEQLYALTQYLYSLKPPKNPNTFPKELVSKGEWVFKKSGCVTCHTPPLYTNNKLTPANGFEPPDDHFKWYNIFNVSVETDSVSTLYARRGTGYYKVPSLRNLWMQPAFFHNAALGSLEEVFDQRRLNKDYVPGGFKPVQFETMAVKGHEFGLDLNEDDKAALIAFLKTL